ncbi:hypothetical protein GcM3_221022 [Golovinomyces cichoracearum]|uniref:Secreted effector protein n=1 Tax=Golovinomyces cichoracearum TaxID=62708 RepID=A0A420H6T4_9PEZI|nr:hypothetical protein GcM3_221022 [Golovinomyces cichoracearum]
MQFPAYIVALSVLVSTVYGHGECHKGNNAVSQEKFRVNVFAPKFVCGGKQIFTDNEIRRAANDICQKRLCNAGCSGSKACPKSAARNRSNPQAGSLKSLKPSETQSDSSWIEGPLPSRCRGWEYALLVSFDQARKECSAQKVVARSNGSESQCQQEI